MSLHPEFEQSQDYLRVLASLHVSVSILEHEKDIADYGQEELHLRLLPISSRPRSDRQLTKSLDHLLSQHGFVRRNVILTEFTEKF